MAVVCPRDSRERVSLYDLVHVGYVDEVPYVGSRAVT